MLSIWTLYAGKYNNNDRFGSKPGGVFILLSSRSVGVGTGLTNGNPANHLNSPVPLESAPPLVIVVGTPVLPDLRPPVRGGMVTAALRAALR